jgi:hypothetical protein
MLPAAAQAVANAIVRKTRRSILLLPRVNNKLPPALSLIPFNGKAGDFTQEINQLSR